MKKLLPALLSIIIFTMCTTSCDSNSKLDDSIVEKANECGLADVSVSYEGTRYEGYSFTCVNLRCSNFSDFSPAEMLEIANDIDEILPDFYLINNVYQGEDTYTLYPSTDSVYLNGEEIYDNWTWVPTNFNRCPNCGAEFGDDTIGVSMIEKHGYCHLCNGRGMND